MPKHISRLLLLFAALAVVGVGAKWYFTAGLVLPTSATTAAIPWREIAAQEPVYQTPRYCKACHTERHAQWSANSHKSVTCEVCHGAAQGHPAERQAADSRRIR